MTSPSPRQHLANAQTIITNILLHLQEEAKANPSSVKSLEAQEEEITNLAKAVSLKHNTVIPKQWLQQNPLQYQGHLKQISQFLVTGPGKWWREVDDGLEFFDVFLPSPSLPRHQMFHYRQLHNIYRYASTVKVGRVPWQWDSPPSSLHQTYTPAGFLQSIHTENTTENTQPRWYWSPPSWNYGVASHLPKKTATDHTTT